MSGEGGWIPRPTLPIPSGVRESLRDRLERHAHAQWATRCAGIAVRFRGAYAYVDAFSSDRHGRVSDCPDRGEGVTTRLCRRGYTGGSDRWAFAFYKYSDETYEPSFLPSGSFEGTPEEAFDCSAQVYLQG